MDQQQLPGAAGADSQGFFAQPEQQYAAGQAQEQSGEALGLDASGDAAFLSRLGFSARMAAQSEPGARTMLQAPSPAPSASYGGARATPTRTKITFINSGLAGGGAPHSPLPTPTQHSATDPTGAEVLERTWRNLAGSFKSNSQAAAEVLVRQAQTAAQLDDLVQVLLSQLRSAHEDRSRLQQALLAERAAAVAAGEEAQGLQRRLASTEQRGSVVAAVTEALQSQLAQARGALEAAERERAQMAEHNKQLQEQLSVTSECRTRGDAVIAEQAAVIEALRQQLSQQATQASTLADDKAALEGQLQGVLRAEQELTVHLRETHSAIEGQLLALRDQLKAERAKRAAVVKRRGELQSQVEALQAQMATQQAEMAGLVERLAARSGAASAHPHPAPQAAPTRSSQGATASRGGPTSHGASGRPGSASGGARTEHGATPSSTAAAVAQLRARSAQRHGSVGGASRHSATSPTKSRGAGAGGAGPSSGGAGAGAGGSTSRGSPPGRQTLNPLATPTAAAAAAPPQPASSPDAGSPGAGDSTVEAASPPQQQPLFEPLHVPSSLPTSTADGAGYAVHAVTAEGHVGPSVAYDSGPTMATYGTPASKAAATPGGRPFPRTVEPPSPPINLLPVPVPGSAGPAGTTGNRRHSISPDPTRASHNAAHNVRRVSPAERQQAGRTAGLRAPSPAAGAPSTWLP
ncbi:hypothetical protein HYH03_003809 [Edaphochlamys debaryana]|uniref:Uncharacterized protein n=1 Tax=Edaphochlamys debaryana TaxID=47281 RepID=A0A835Y8L0_9CHLO|nr:hypothetical protein HYH03_003809 [Edaphochlamys debaryana]|eukprot:KAG2498048.1 hypothetical protein HYH03_003809 [Edaphochlamys debaryana]